MDFWSKQKSNTNSLKLRAMKAVKISILVFAINVNIGCIFANWIYISYFGNVTTLIITDIGHEEVNKMDILGQLAKKLAEKLNYSAPISIFFDHTFGEEFNHNHTFFLSYEINRRRSLLRRRSNNTIRIQQVGKQLQIPEILKLLEYAILNSEEIKLMQTEIEYYRFFRNRTINTIDTLAIRSILNAPNSSLLSDVLRTRIDRPEKDSLYGLSYFWQNNRFYVFHKCHNDNVDRRTVLFDVDNIYQFARVGQRSALIFDTDSSFFFVQRSNMGYLIEIGQPLQFLEPKISKKHIIENMNRSFEPFTVTDIGGVERGDARGGMISIYFLDRQTRMRDERGNIILGAAPGRTLLYLPKSDILIQDLYKLIEQQQNGKSIF